MNKETYEALKFVMNHATNGGPNDKEFWDNVKLVEGWIDEVAKEYTGEEPACSHYLPELVEDGRWTTLHCRHCFARQWAGRWMSKEEFNSVRELDEKIMENMKKKGGKK